ncbi:hypothetical protein Poli38472_000385 [Pythium oligandrum]|uniref:Vacuolar membrane-associated protein iml1 n=1 Tax=Pythium oligandrum TaxID=41045 RepID=A0A8K1FJ31_PYTOL|nr:hypothetical protein Poli38472_000385 [Pythium oligandrum]|eukprot:TMW60343.1 hypothetical protein Poli38472_000385 [Pythium oligandrum]
MRRRYNRSRLAAVAATAATGAPRAPLSTAGAAPVAAVPSTLNLTALPRHRLTETVKLHVHERGHELQNNDELVLNPEYFPQLKEFPMKDFVVEIFHPSELDRRREEDAANTPLTPADYDAARQHLLLEIPESSTTPVKGKWQMSVVKDMAAVFQLAPFHDVMLRFLPKEQVALEFVEISLKDQFMSRRDLWYLRQSLVGTALYVGKSVRVHGTRWQVMDVRANGTGVRSGVVGKRTKFAFRSRTSRVMWLVQLSPEMWEMANSGKLYLEIFLQVVQNILDKWTKHKASHSLTIIFFARSYYPELDAPERDVGYGALSTPPRPQHPRLSSAHRSLHHQPPRRNRSDSAAPTANASSFPFAGKNNDAFSIGVDENGRHYQDFYKIVAFDSMVTDVQPLLVQLKQEMNEFPHLCGWRSPRSPPPSRTTVNLAGDEERAGRSGAPGTLPQVRPGIPSHARDGNLLEAINIVLNIFEKHHIDRHLARSGQSVVLLTAGNGIFSVNKHLAEITEQRMMDHGIGIDMIALSTPPLHKCPLFLFKQSDTMTELTLSGQAVGAEAAEVCTCGNQHLITTTAMQPPSASRNGQGPRRSRTGSSDLGNTATTVDAPQPATFTDTSVRGGNAGQLCKHCLQRLSERKRYQVPLWIPLSFVQERMMVRHKCPLDEDIASSCSVCRPRGAVEARGFEPLPMSRMFRDISTWKETPRSFSSSSNGSLPMPLERLLNHFKDVDNATMVSEEDDDHGDLRFRTFSSEFSLMDDDYLALGRDSELVRVRAPSLTGSDDPILYDRSTKDPLPKLRSFAPSDLKKTRLEFEAYDDAVFSLPTTKGSSSYKNQRSGDDENGNANSSGRLCLTPPTKASSSTFTSTKKKRPTSGTFHSNSAGGLGDPQSGPGSDPPSRWRNYESLASSSPGPPTRNSGDGRFVGQHHSSGGDDELNDDSDPTQEVSTSRGRTLGGSLPNTFQMLVDSGSAHANSPILVPTAEASVKDDLFHSHAYIYKHLTSNQRRWSHVRPKDDNHPYRLVQNSLKWKSLIFPALLPLTTDFIPGPTELQAHYTESFYSVTIPERDEQSGATFRDYRELVMEMVAQRFSQDFQLVTMEDTKASGKRRGGSVFRLSMGHRIHEIRYNEETQTVDVKRYLQRATARSDVDIMEYRYALWSPVADGFLFASQEFRKYPRVEYSWNYLDQLICGYYDDMSEAIRYKRILLCVIPPALDQNESDEVKSEILKTYTERSRKFLEYLRSKAENSSMFPNIRISTEWRENMATSGVAAFKRVGQENVKIALHASDSPTSQNWLITRLDTELMATQCFHIEVQWLVCRSALVDDFIAGLTRRGKQLGLELLQVAENGVSNNLELHPLICPIFLPIHDPAEQRIVEASLVDRYQFCCEGLHAIPHVHLNRDDEYKILNQEPVGRTRRRVSYYRQYVHRSQACYVRLTQTGLIWISNRKLQCQDIQQTYEGIRELVEAVHIAHAALKGVLEDVVDGHVAALLHPIESAEALDEPAREPVSPVIAATDDSVVEKSNVVTIVPVEEKRLEQLAPAELAPPGDYTDEEATEHVLQPSAGSVGPAAPRAIL